ncbi:MAG TPA: HAD family hydrolase [Gemmatimonadales bacterium]|jgi:putative hydrolase of the HAD superfamily|nr:HAD family hydrolase [Gemmatimonadales bacterium]
MPGPVLFDFGGTLDADGEPWGERMYRGYRAAGGRAAPAAFDDGFGESDRRLALTPGIAALGLSAMVERQIELLRPLLADGRAVDARAWAAGFLGAVRVTAARNLPVLRELKRTRPLGVISNFTGNLRPCLEELGLLDCFDVVLDSAVVGLRKPDARLFRVAFTAFGRGAKECWMVGDNPAADIAAAAALGCSTCWLAPAERPLPAGLRPDRRIGSLTELPAVLD